MIKRRSSGRRSCRQPQPRHLQVNRNAARRQEHPPLAVAQLKFEAAAGPLILGEYKMCYSFFFLLSRSASHNFASHNFLTLCFS
jgi:hypothetical protein